MINNYKENIIDWIRSKYQDKLLVDSNNKTPINLLLNYLNSESIDDWIVEIRVLKDPKHDRIIYYMLGTRYNKEGDIIDNFNFGSLFNTNEDKKGELPMYVEDIVDSNNNIFEKFHAFLDLYVK
jgi:hypothetical protein